MALTQGYFWEFPLNSEVFLYNNSVISNPGVYFGFKVTPSLLSMNLNLGEGVLLMPSGAVITNSSNMANALGVPDNTNSSPKIDSIVIEYKHSSDPTSNIPIIRLLEGDASANPIAPSPNEYQLLIATIYLPPFADSLTDENVVITEVGRISNLTPKGIKFRATDDDNLDLVFDKETNSLIASGDIKTFENIIPASLTFNSIKLAMEGIYSGNFSVVHDNYNDYGSPTSSIVTIKDNDGVSLISCNVNYIYNINMKLDSRIFIIGDWIITETYTYDINHPDRMPSFEQVITNA